MQIKWLRLNNFGVFQGIVQLDLSPEKDRNIILIGGQNGSGKTTLLDAIKVALYGPFAFGFKNANTAYLSYIQDHLNRNALVNQSGDFEVGIGLEMMNTGQIESVVILRRWILGTTRPKEVLIVTKDDRELNSRETSDFMHYYFNTYPPTLQDFFYFDGERLHEYFSGGRFEDELRLSALTLFNLDIFANLSEDIKAYLRQNNSFKHLHQFEDRVLELEACIRDTQDNMDKLTSEIENIEAAKEDRNLAIRELEEEFRIHGGLMAEERIRIQHENSQMEERKGELHDWLKNTVADVFPFYLAKDLLLKMKQRIQMDEEYRIAQQLADRIETEKLKSTLAKGLEVQGLNVNEISLDQLTKVLQELIIPPLPSRDYQPIHFLSDEEKESITNVIQKLGVFSADELVNAFEEISDLNKSILVNRKALEENTDNSDLDDILKQISILHKTHEEEASHRAELDNRLENIYRTLSQLEIQLAAAKESLENSRRDETVHNLGNRIQSVADSFIEQQTYRKIKKMERDFTNMISVLIRKENLITGIAIDSRFRSIELQGPSGIIPRHHLSAGEKQIYVLSLIWALINSSQKELPLVFDTLIGRLDRQHKESVITHFLPHASSQTIILSTDTEIDSTDYQSLAPHIAKQYLLNYDTKSRSVDIQPHYFFTAVIKGGKANDIMVSGRNQSQVS